MAELVRRAGAGRHWVIWAAAIAIAAWAAARMLGAERGFPLVPLMAYTPYVAVAALLTTGAAIALRNWAAAGVSVLATACLAAAVLPRTAGSATPVGPGETELAVLSANVRRGKADPDELMALIERWRPDVLSVQELTPRFAARLERAGIGQALPHRVLSVRPASSGGGLYARFPLRRLRERRPFGFRMPRAEVDLTAGRRARIVDVHPYPPSPSQVGRWRAGLESLPATGAGRVPWVLVGDFNATLDHAEMRAVLDKGYRDAADVAGRGLVPTWPAAGMRLPPVTIDHVLAPHRLGVAGYAVADLPGSDHRAVFARLAVP